MYVCARVKSTVQCDLIYDNQNRQFYKVTCHNRNIPYEWWNRCIGIPWNHETTSHTTLFILLLNLTLKCKISVFSVYICVPIFFSYFNLFTWEPFSAIITHREVIEFNSYYIIRSTWSRCVCVYIYIHSIHKYIFYGLNKEKW